MSKTRCAWVPLADQLYTDYHDYEWGAPVHDDKVHFEFLLLESAQAGLSWSTILKKRDGYRKAYANFDPQKVAKYTSKDEIYLLNNEKIVRNRLKISSAINNAKCFLLVQKEFGSFDNYIWAFVANKPIVNNWKTISQIPPTTELSKNISKNLKKRGFRFLGPTTVYAYLQAVGIVNDHTSNCFRHKELLRAS